MKFSLFSQSKPLHILYLPVFFVCNHFFTIVTPRNSQLVDNIWHWIFNFFGAIGICIAFSFGVYKLMRIRFNSAKSAILSSLLLFPFFFFQDLFLAFDQWKFDGLRARWVLPILAILVVLICYFVIRSNKSFRSLTQYLNVLFFSLSIYTICTVIISFRDNFPNVLTYTPSTKYISCSDCPDIYFFVLDSYTSNKSLREYFHFDNANFTQRLTGLGFSVKDQSISSYSRTAYSLSAILNFNYVKDLDQYSLIGESIQNNAVVNSLRMKNYSIRNYSIFDIGNQPAYYHLAPNMPFGFVNGVLSSSILNIIIYDFSSKLKLYEINANILKQISKESEAPGKQPRFFYCHIMAPHPPFVIDAEGQEINFFKQSHSFANESAYKNQLEGINKMILPTLSKVVKSSPNSIVIIMGDHGYRYLSGPGGAEEAFTAFVAYKGINQDALDSLSRSNQIFQLLFTEKK